MGKKGGGSNRGVWGEREGGGKRGRAGEEEPDLFRIASVTAMRNANLLMGASCVHVVGREKLMKVDKTLALTGE